MSHQCLACTCHNWGGRLDPSGRGRGRHHQLQRHQLQRHGAVRGLGVGADWKPLQT